MLCKSHRFSRLDNDRFGGITFSYGISGVIDEFLGRPTKDELFYLVVEEFRAVPLDRDFRSR